MDLKAMWQAISEGRGVEELKVFLSQGGDVNARHANSGWPLLALAVECQNIPAIVALVRAGADMEAAIDEQSWRPLHLAVDIDVDGAVQTTNGDEEFFKALTFEATRTLISLGAVETVRDVQGRTPRDLVASYGGDVLAKYDEISRAP